MNVRNFADIIMAFATDQRTLALTALVILDLCFGLAAALKAGKFDWERVAAWYRTNVFPYIICYFAVWIVSMFGLVQVLDAVLPSAGAALVGEISAYGLAVPAAITLAGSIRRNLTVISESAESAPQAPAPAVADVPPPQ